MLVLIGLPERPTYQTFGSQQEMVEREMVYAVE